jgi:hypothetical protein
MWTKLDDALLDHAKIFAAGDLIGRNGAGLALGMFVIGLMWTNKHLTDGHLPAAVVKRWHHVEQPTRIADALVAAGLWDRNGDGYIVHDFHDHNPQASEVHAHRRDVSVIRSQLGRIGGLKSGETRKKKG